MTKAIFRMTKRISEVTVGASLTLMLGVSACKYDVGSIIKGKGDGLRPSGSGLSDNSARPTASTLTYGFTEAENRAFLAFVLKVLPRHEKLCESHFKTEAVSSDGDYTAKTKEHAARWVTGCRGRYGVFEGLSADDHEQMRNDPELPELVKAGSLARTFRASEPDELPDVIWDNSDYASEMVYYGRDLAGIDRGKLLKEVADLKLPPLLQWQAMKHVGHVQHLAKYQLAELSKVIKKDPWVKDVIIDAPKAGATAWLALIKANKPAFDLAMSYRAKFQKTRESKAEMAKAFAGCEEQLVPHIAKYLKAQKVKTLDSFLVISTDPVGSALFNALAACTAAVGHRGAAGAIYTNVIKHGAPANGPREAACVEARKKYAMVAADREKMLFKSSRFCSNEGNQWSSEVLDRFEVKSPTFPVVWTSRPGGKDKEKEETPDGAVASVKPGKTGVVLTFKVEEYKEGISDCRPTGKFAYWDFSDGRATPMYQQTCKFAGYQTYTTQIPSMFVPPFMADGLKPDTQVRTFEIYDKSRAPGSPQDGAILEVYKGKDRKQLVSVLGFSL